MNRLMLIGPLAAAVLVASGCGSSGTNSSHQTAATPRTLTDLHSIGQLQRAFNSASGEPRLIVLVSPT
jgi:hypothetical protein